MSVPQMAPRVGGKTVADLPDELCVDDLGEGKFQVHHPSEDAEGRDVVFSGQVMAQMIMAADQAVNSEKEVKSIHAIFARAASYTLPLYLQLETMHSGRAWASHTITATQGDKLMSRALVLMNAVEPDLIRHGPAMPDVPAPESLSTARMLTFPGLETRPVEAPDAAAADGSPATYFWMRYDRPLDSLAANQAVLVWSQPGMIIGLAMRDHRDKVEIGQAHRSVSTGVIDHIAHFHEALDVSQWLLVAQQATYAGRGRVYGSGSVFTRDGQLVSTFGQDSMVRTVEGPLDPKRAM
jgi:acyl-CoA thioesterase II